MVISSQNPINWTINIIRETVMIQSKIVLIFVAGSILNNCISCLFLELCRALISFKKYTNDKTRVTIIEIETMYILIVKSEENLYFLERTNMKTGEPKTKRILNRLTRYWEIEFLPKLPRISTLSVLNPLLIELNNEMENENSAI